MSLQVTSIAAMVTEVMQMLTDLNEQGTTIVMVTHSEHDITVQSPYYPYAGWTGCT